MIGKAILKINPNAIFYCADDNDLDSIKWLEGTTPIPKADIEAKMAEVQAELNAKQYQNDRANAYPSIGDQLDMLWHSIDQDAELKQKYFDFYQAIKSVKVKYPKNG